MSRSTRGAVGYVGGIQIDYLDRNWIGKSGKRGVAYQDDSYPGNEAKHRT